MTIIQDIEELDIPLDSAEIKASRASSRFVTPKIKNRELKKIDGADGDDGTRDVVCDQGSVNHRGDGDLHFLPGQHKIFVKTWGCSHNNSDSEYMAGLLVSHGYSLIMSDANRDAADLWLLNSCTVKNPSEQTFVNEIKRAQKLGIPVVLAGCVPQAQPNNQHWSKLSVIGVQQIDRVVEVVEETLRGNTVRVFGVRKEVLKENEDNNGHAQIRKRKAGGAQLDLPKIRRNPYIEIVPINTGCLNQCTYCKTKHARGDLGSYPSDEIIRRVEQVLDEGIVEIWLTSEDTGAYGRDIDERLPSLLKGIVAALENAYNNDGKEVMLRIGMTNPPYILDDLEEIAEILNNPRVYKFLHIPVQSGSDRVLDDMRRQYTADDFRHVVEFLRARVPGITIATDLICGFPTEQKEDHQDSVDLVNEMKFPVLHISQFYPRPGTPAAKMQRLPTNIVKERSREITRLFESYTTYDNLNNTIQRVWITDELVGSAEENENMVPPGEDTYESKSNTNGRYTNCWIAHDIFYHQVLIPKEEMKSMLIDSDTWSVQNSFLGCACDVRISQTGKHYLIGKLESPESLKFANTTAVTSTVLLHRSGKNNRKITAENTVKNENNEQTKREVDVEPKPISGPPKTENSGTSYSIYMSFILFLTISALHVLSIPAVIKLIDPSLYAHYPLLKTIEISAMQPYLEHLHTQIGLWILLGLTTARILSAPTPTE